MHEQKNAILNNARPDKVRINWSGIAELWDRKIIRNVGGLGPFCAT